MYLLKHFNRDDNVFNFDEDVSYIVLKKIDLISLIEKYIIKYKASEMLFKSKHTSQAISHQITPWNKNYIENEKKKEEDEIIYYKDKLQKLIQNEVDLMSNIYHYNIVKMFDYSININEIKFEYILKLEYMNCGDLYKLLKTEYEPFQKYRNEYGGFNNELCKYILLNITNGLKFLHDLNIIHRDIKLNNILVSNTGPNIKDFKIKISDLGFACMNPKDENKNLPIYLIKDLKEKWKKICGTPYYMAPEIIKNIGKEINYSYKSDIWSLGISLYEMYFNILPLTNLKHIQEIIKFFRDNNVQKNIDIILKKINTNNLWIKNILFKTLRIDESKRINVNELINVIEINQKAQNYNIDKINDSILSMNQEINEFLKKSFVEINLNNMDILEDSWIHLEHCGI